MRVLSLLVLLAGAAVGQETPRDWERLSPEQRKGLGEFSFTAEEHRDLLTLANSFDWRFATPPDELNLRWLKARTFDAEGRPRVGGPFYLYEGSVIPPVGENAPIPNTLKRQECEAYAATRVSRVMPLYRGNADVRPVTGAGTLGTARTELLPDVFATDADAGRLAARRFSFEFDRTFPSPTGEKKYRCQVIAFVHDDPAVSLADITWPFIRTGKAAGLFGGYTRPETILIPWPTGYVPTRSATRAGAYSRCALLGQTAFGGWSWAPLLRSVLGDQDSSASAAHWMTIGIPDPPILVHLFYKGGDRAQFSSWVFYQDTTLESLLTK